MSIILLAILFLILLYSAFKQDIGMYACFSILFFNVLVTLFHVISPQLFSLNAIFHVGAFVVLLIWQFNYYSWKSIRHYFTNPVILSIISISIIMYLYNDISPYYYTYKPLIDRSQFGFYSRILFPLLLLPVMLPDAFSKQKLINSIPLWGIIYVIVFACSFNLSSNILSDRTILADTSGNIIGSIDISRIFAVAAIATFIKIIEIDKNDEWFIIYIGLILLFLMVVLIAGQRGTLIGLVLGLSCLMLRKDWRHYSITIVLLGVICWFIALTFIDWGQLEIFQRFSQLKDIESFERYYDYIRTWDIFKDNHFSRGLGSMGYHFKTGRPYPHNIILEHISDYGIAGLFCISILLCFCIKYSVALIRYSNEDSDLTIAICWIVLFFSALVSSSLLNNYFFYIFSGLLVMAYINFHNLSIGEE